MGLYLMTWAFRPTEVPLIAAFIVNVAILIIAAVVSAVLGGFLADSIERLREVASALAEAIDCRLDPSTNLFIVRKVGDEASLALGGGQLFFWATSKAFAHLAIKGSRLFKSAFTGRPLPKAIRALWCIALAEFVALIGGRLISVFLGVPPTKFDALVDAVSDSALVKFNFDLVILTILATMVVKFTLFETWLFGATLLGLAGAASLGNFAFGTTPSLGIDEERGSFSRWLAGTLLALLIEINTEATPAGRWVIRQFEPTDDDRRADSNVLVHSAYGDPVVIENLIQWLAASTDLRDERVDHAS